MPTFHTSTNNDSTVTFEMDESRNFEVTATVVRTGANPLTVDLLNQDGTVKLSVTIPANSTVTRTFNPSQRVQGILRSLVNSSGENKLVLQIPHRILW